MLIDKPIDELRTYLGSSPLPRISTRTGMNRWPNWPRCRPRSN